SPRTCGTTSRSPSRSSTSRSSSASRGTRASLEAKRGQITFRPQRKVIRPLLLVTRDGAVRARIGAALEEAVGVAHDGARVPDDLVVGADQLHFVAHPRERLDHGGRKARLELQRVAHLAPGAPEEPAR